MTEYLLKNSGWKFGTDYKRLVSNSRRSQTQVTSDQTVPYQSYRISDKIQTIIQKSVRSKSSLIWLKQVFNILTSFTIHAFRDQFWWQSFWCLWFRLSVLFSRRKEVKWLFIIYFFLFCLFRELCSYFEAHNANASVFFFCTFIFLLFLHFFVALDLQIWGWFLKRPISMISLF